MPYKRGHVVATRRDGCGVIWHADDTHVWISPIGGCNGHPPHRADVRIEDLSDAHEMGITFKYPVVRCQTMLRVPIRRLTDTKPLGMTPPLLLARIEVAVRKEVAAQAAEQRMMCMRKPGATSVVAM